MKIVTTPIFYANAKPHVGHLYSALLCDIWKRVSILLKKNVLFCSGMDEHGQKVFEAARARGYDVQEYVNKVSQEFMEFFKDFDIFPDKWIRTTNPQHKETVQYIWQELFKKGFIYKGVYEGWYSISDEAYIDHHDETKKDPNIFWRHEECYYFKLSAFQKQLEEFYKKHEDFVFPKTRYNEVLGFIKQGLKDFVISRPKVRLSWGIPVPNDNEQVIYVWFDALINYISATGFPSPKYKRYWSAKHVLGKDILKFHAIYWLAILFALEVKPPERLIIHGWLLNSAAKISKSAGNAVDLKELIEKYQVDGIRYALISGLNLGSDVEFNEEFVKNIVHSELANKYGNTFLRVAGILQQLFDGKIVNEKFEDLELIAYVTTISSNLNLVFKDITKINQYVKSFMNAVLAINEYFEKNQVWKIADNNRKQAVICFLLNLLKRIAILSSPILPSTSKKILDSLGLPCVMEQVYLPLVDLNCDLPILFPKDIKTI